MAADGYLYHDCTCVRMRVRRAGWSDAGGGSLADKRSLVRPGWGLSGGV